MTDVNAKQRTMPGECPSRQVLTDFALGKLPLEEIEQLGRHIETCPTCQGVLETLDNLEDSVVADIKGQTAPLPPDPRLLEQIRQAEEISRVVWGEPKTDVPEEPLPAHLGQYRILERIGRGGMGTVYKARHPHLKRDVAIKVLPKDRLRDPQSVARFQREMEAVGRLDHTNLVRAHDAGESDGQHYLVMEFLDGADLRKLVRQHGPLPMANACEIVRQAAMGLQYAHEHGLIHRDIKPSNLILTSEGIVKVLDLGLARLGDEAGTTGDMTGSGLIVGTGDFISPEQGQDTRNADARSDIYSLGCTLYFLLAGKAPFSDSQHGSFVQKVMAHAHEPIPPIQAVRKDVPEAVVSIIARMTAKVPEQRLQTPAEVAKTIAILASGSELKSALSGRSGGQGIGQPPHALRHQRISRRLLLVLLLVLPALLFGGWFAGMTLPRRWHHAAVDTLDEPLTMRKAEAIGKKIADDMQPDIRKIEQHFAKARRSMDEQQEAIIRSMRANTPAQGKIPP
jgi:serine/threonine protein kinase